MYAIVNPFTFEMKFVVTYCCAFIVPQQRWYMSETEEELSYREIVEILKKIKVSIKKTAI